MIFKEWNMGTYKQTPKRCFIFHLPFSLVVNLIFLHHHFRLTALDPRGSEQILIQCFVLMHARVMSVRCIEVDNLLELNSHALEERVRSRVQ